MRLFPQDQNTGGFFVCVLEKAGNAEVKAETTEPVPPPPALDDEPVVEDAVVADENGTSTLKRGISPSADAGPEAVKKTKQEEKKDAKKEEKRKKRDPSWKEDPFSYVDVDHKEVGLIVYVSPSNLADTPADMAAIGSSYKTPSARTTSWSVMTMENLSVPYISQMRSSR